MDVQEHPYASNAARLQLLYQLASGWAARHLLIVSAEEPAPRLLNDWPGQVTRMNVAELVGANASMAPRFDAVALPNVLGVCAVRSAGTAPATGNVDLLSHARGLLVPGGTVVGHMGHAWALRAMLAPGGVTALAKAAWTPGAITTPAQCLRRLAQAGLHAGQCFYVLPSIEAPMALIPCQRAAARRHFARAIRSTRSNHTAFGHSARRLVAGLGLAGVFQSELFFWARAPC